MSGSFGSAGSWSSKWKSAESKGLVEALEASLGHGTLELEEFPHEEFQSKLNKEDLGLIWHQY